MSQSWSSNHLLRLRPPARTKFIARARILFDDGWTIGGFDTVQATWNLLEPSVGPALADAHREGLGVIVKEALANGRLTSRGGGPELEQVAQRLGASPDAVALAAALAQPWADVVLSGAASKEQITSNLAARRVAWNREAAETLDRVAEEPEAYWRTRPELVWN